MPDIESMYRKMDGQILIEIRLSSIMQLFNSFDPAPFHEKELDSAAEHYIVETVKDFPKNTRFRITIYLPPDVATSERALKIPQAIHNHFEYRVLVQDRKFRERFRYGRFALIVGLSFLAVALFARQEISQVQHLLPAQIIGDALMIMGWAAMWEPVTVILYDLWPIIQLKHTFEKISMMEIEILPHT